MKRTWNDYEWQEWIPNEVRKQIERFWLDSWNRGPDAWYRDMKDQGSPELGLECSLPKLASEEWTHGRFVHAWNNIGQMIHEDGTFSYVYFTAGGLFDSRPIIEPEASESTESAQ